MSEFLEVLSPSALKDLQALNSELVKTVANVKTVNENMIGIKTPSGSDSAIKDLNAQLAKQTQLYAKAQIELERYAQAQNRTKISNNQLEKSNMSLEQSVERKNKALERENAKLQLSQSLYTQTQQKVNELTKVYNDLAIKKQLGEKLTASEVIQLHKLTSELNTYQTALKKVDADIQKNQRNVGNYASGWNGLGNSINQLSREMPAFANSAQTGFMALSNNLPILFDEIERIKTANKELLAQGQPIKSVFSQIAGAVLSWGTALSIGVTLLTIFGPKLWDMVSSSKAKKVALENEKKALEEKQSAEKSLYEQQVRYASDEQARAKILLETAKNISLSMEQRTKAVKELQERYPSYLGNLSKEKILAGETAVAESQLNDALMKRAMFLAVQDKIIEVTKQLVDSEMKYAETNAKSTKTEELYDLAIQKKIASKQKYRLVNEQDLQTTKGLEAVVKSGDKAIVNSTTVYNEKTLATRKQLDVLYKLLNGYAKYSNVVVENTKADKKATEAKEEKRKADSGSLQAMEDTISALKQEQRLVEFGTEKYEALGAQIKLLETIYKGLTETIKEVPEDLSVSLTDEQVYEEYFAWLKLKEATDSYIDTLTSGAIEKGLDSIGMASLKMFTDFDENGKNTFDKLIEGTDNTMSGMLNRFAITFQAIGDIGQELFNKLTELSNANFENEYANLERQRDIALAFAGDSEAGREEIQRQFEERRRAIRKREFQAEKQMALFNIAIDTAQAVIASVAKSPLTFGLPFSAVAIAIGAAQAGIVASQQMPQFWKGTDNAPAGLAWTQEKGAEIITDKNGNIKTLGSNKGAQMTMLEKGDKVFTAEKSALMFENGLNNILLSNGIESPKIEINTPKIDLTPVINAINNKESVNINIGKNGLNTYIANGHTKKEIMNNRFSFIGKSV